MTDKDPPACRSCRYHAEQVAECRRAPPVPVISSLLVQLPGVSTTMIPGLNPTAAVRLQTAVGLWPKVSPDAWCGEFRAASDS